MADVSSDPIIGVHAPGVRMVVIRPWIEPDGDRHEVEFGFWVDPVVSVLVRQTEDGEQWLDFVTWSNLTEDEKIFSKFDEDDSVILVACHWPPEQDRVRLRSYKQQALGRLLFRDKVARRLAREGKLVAHPTLRKYRVCPPDPHDPEHVAQDKDGAA